jgi:hypothetical protein
MDRITREDLLETGAVQLVEALSADANLAGEASA